MQDTSCIVGSLLDLSPCKNHCDVLDLKTRCMGINQGINKICPKDSKFRSDRGQDSPIQTDLARVIICLLYGQTRNARYFGYLPRATLGTRDFSSAVSVFCQVFIVTRAKKWLRRSWLRPMAENVRRTREKPLVPRVSSRSGTERKQ